MCVKHHFALLYFLCVSYDLDESLGFYTSNFFKAVDLQTHIATINHFILYCYNLKFYLQSRWFMFINKVGDTLEAFPAKYLTFSFDICRKVSVALRF